jgi:hypothetical protein
MCVNVITDGKTLVPGADLEVVLGSSSELSMDASSVSVCTSSNSSSSEERAQSPAESLSHCSGSAADLTSLSGFYQQEAHHCLTSDGWKLHIMHVYDATAEASTSGRQYSSSDSRKPHHPVLMIPGLASSGKHTFDLLPQHSLVNALVAKGYDVWVADLRGGYRTAPQLQHVLKHMPLQQYVPGHPQCRHTFTVCPRSMQCADAGCCRQQCALQDERSMACHTLSFVLDWQCWLLPSSFVRCCAHALLTCRQWPQPETQPAGQKHVVDCGRPLPAGRACCAGVCAAGNGRQTSALGGTQHGEQAAASMRQERDV